MGFVVVYFGSGFSFVREAITWAEEAFPADVLVLDVNVLEWTGSLPTPSFLCVPYSDIRLINASVFGGYRKSSIGACSECVDPLPLTLNSRPSLGRVNSLAP
jgi:hypothetical protein